MARIWAAVVILAAGSAWSAPALAQERVLKIFGEDKCPVNTICVRAPEKERFRIPKELRKVEPSHAQRSWASRVSSTMNEGATGPSACAAASGGSWNGCFGEEMAKAREEARLAREGNGDAVSTKQVRVLSTP